MLTTEGGDSLPEGSILYLTLQCSSSRLDGGSTNSIFFRASVRNLLYLYGASESAFWVKMKDPATNWPSWQCPPGRRNVQHISTAESFTADIFPSHFFFFIFDSSSVGGGWSHWWLTSLWSYYVTVVHVLMLHSSPSGCQVETSRLCSVLNLEFLVGKEGREPAELRSVCW